MCNMPMLHDRFSNERWEGGGGGGGALNHFLLLFCKSVYLKSPGLKCATIQSLLFHHGLLKNSSLSHVELKVLIFSLFILQFRSQIWFLLKALWLLKPKIFFEQHQSTAASFDRLSRRKRQSIQPGYPTRVPNVSDVLRPLNLIFALNEAYSHDNRKIVLTTQWSELITLWSGLRFSANVSWGAFCSKVLQSPFLLWKSCENPDIHQSDGAALNSNDSS